MSKSIELLYRAKGNDSDDKPVETLELTRTR